MRDDRLGVRVALSFLFGAATAASPVAASASGTLVDVSVLVEGRTAPLYAARDGSGRFYLEAREGARYEIRLRNRSPERLGILVGVDGLNAISGEIDRSRARPGQPGRMYVLSPFEDTSVRGWRTSLDEVRLFTFVDERASYAVRSGRDNGRLGWIEVAVYRELRPLVWQPRDPAQLTPPAAWRDGEARTQAAPAEAPPAETVARAEAGRDPAKTASEADALESRRDAPSRDSYPGTGWGRSETDRATLVHFDPCPDPAERITLRYEYALELVRLGAWTGPAPTDRLWERDRGRRGFASPPPR